MGPEVQLIATLLAVACVLEGALLLARWQRHRTWQRTEGVVDTAYYKVVGKNVFALVDVSYEVRGKKTAIQGVPTGGVDLKGFCPGNPISLLVHPRANGRCVVDRSDVGRAVGPEVQRFVKLGCKIADRCLRRRTSVATTSGEC